MLSIYFADTRAAIIQTDEANYTANGQSYFTSETSFLSLSQIIRASLASWNEFSLHCARAVAKFAVAAIICRVGPSLGKIVREKRDATERHRDPTASTSESIRDEILGRV